MKKRKPTVLAVEKQERTPLTEVLLHLFVEADIAYFNGHFTHFPLLPGVTQLDWAVYYAAEYLNTSDSFQGMEVIKFQEPIFPDAKVSLALSWNAERQKLTFKYTSLRDELPIVHSSGRFILGECG